MADVGIAADMTVLCPELTRKLLWYCLRAWDVLVPGVIRTLMH